MNDIFELHRGTAPLLVSLPHNGSEIPAGAGRAHGRTRAQAPDTDWHVARLYAFARELGASMLVPRYSRYVIDLNRPPDDTSLYPGQNTTGLCPAVQFTGEPVYLRRAGAVAGRDRGSASKRYWRPYHEALQAELARLHAAHGRVLLWEGHSIRAANCAFLFRALAGPQSRHVGRRQLLAAARRPRVEAALAAQSRVRLRGQRPLQGRLHHAPLRRSGQRHRCDAAGDQPAHLHGRGQRSPTTRRKAASAADA